MTKDLRENLINYIMSVQSLVDRLHIMEKERNSLYSNALYSPVEPTVM